MNPCLLLWITPSANRNSYRVAKHYYIFTQGRGAAHLNPGLRNRNSFRVAVGKPHPSLPQGRALKKSSIPCK